MTLGKRRVRVVAGVAAVVATVAAVAVWQSTADSDIGPYHNPRPANPLDAVTDPVLRAKLGFPPPTGVVGVLDCDESKTGGAMGLGVRYHTTPPPPRDAPGWVSAPPTVPRRYPTGWHQPARTPEEAAENLTINARRTNSGTVGSALTYVVGERSDEAGAANVYGTFEGRRLRLVPIRRGADGAWSPWNMLMDEPAKYHADDPPASRFATFEEQMAYVPDHDPDAVWTWQGGAAISCGGLHEPAP